MCMVSLYNLCPLWLMSLSAFIDPQACLFSIALYFLYQCCVSLVHVILALYSKDTLWEQISPVFGTILALLSQKSQILVQEDTCSPQMDSYGYITHAQYAPIQHGQNPESTCLQKGNQQQCTGHHTVTLWKMLKIPEANGKQVFLQWHSQSRMIQGGSVLFH